MQQSKSGYLRKNHRGSAFKVRNELRYFSSVGFNVQYFKNEDKTSRCGRFDLRNITRLAKPADPDVPSGLSFAILGKDGEFVVSFDGVEDADAQEWMTLWTSAVEEKYVDAALKPMRSAELAAAMNVAYHEQKPMRASSFAPSALISPRRPMEIPVKKLEEDAGYDTPRSASVVDLKPAAPTPVAPPAAVDAVPTGDTAEGGTETVDALDVLVVEVPEGVKPGARLRVTAPNGVKVIITVPEGCVAGNQLEFKLPDDEEAAPAAPADAAPPASPPPTPVSAPAEASPTPAAAPPEPAKASWLQCFGLTTCLMSEELRLAKFKEAIRAYDWGEAMKLAVSAEEREDISDSIMRVKQLEESIDSHDFELADELAITKAERERVLAARAA